MPAFSPPSSTPPTVSRPPDSVPGPERAEATLAPGTEDTELFVSCEPAVALQQQFEQRPLPYVALHDIGPAASRRLLTGVAAASHRPMQRLLVRRRGYGDLLATVHFVDLSGGDGQPLRVYTTDVEAADTDRRSLMHTLMAFSSLSVAMVAGDALRDADAGLADLDRALAQRPWPNRHLLLLPMGPALRLASVGQAMALRHGLQVLTAPVVNRPSEAWHFIQSSHARLHSHGDLHATRRSGAGEGLSPRTAAHTGPDAIPTEPSRLIGRADRAPLTGFSRPGGLARPSGPSSLPPLASGPRSAPPNPWADEPVERAPGTTTAAAGLRTTPSTFPPSSPPGPASRRDAPEGSIAWTTGAPSTPAAVHAALLERVSRMGGFVAGCVFNLASGRAVAHRGEGPEPQAMGRRAAALVNASTEAGRSLYLDAEFSEVWITLGRHHLIVRPVPGHRDLGLHVLLDRQASNPMLARVQLQRLDDDPRAFVADTH